jgi:predicted nucleotidyltransferase
VDVVYRRTPENLVRVVESWPPIIRTYEARLPVRWDAETLRHGLNLTLITDLGSIDLLGEIVGGGTYDELLPHTVRLDPFGIECLCLGLERLIHVKRAAGRVKDLEAIAELEVIVEERRRLAGSP